MFYNTRLDVGDKSGFQRWVLQQRQGEAASDFHFRNIKSDGLFTKGRAIIAINRGTCHLTKILLTIHMPICFPG